jgi:methyl acetate hydrolase
MRMVENPEVVPGGHYLYSSCNDYAQFLLTLLNDGTHPKSGVKILGRDTVQNYIFKDLLPSLATPPDTVGVVPSTVNPVTCTGTLLPDVPKGWSAGALINNTDAPNGRKKGSAMWAGLGNCYFWMDPTAGKLGFVVSAVLPFFDRDVLYLADALERAVYGKPQAKEIGEKGSNFEGGVVKDAEQ